MMDFRFALIAAGSADSAARAAEIAETMRRAGKRDPRGAIAEVLGALDGSPVGHYLLECRNTSRGALLSVERPEAGLLEALLLLAKDHSLAVYDIDLNRLYDPAGAANVEALMPGVRSPFLTRPLLDDLVRRPGWPEPEAPYVIVERAHQDYVQAWLGDDGVYHLEYREGGPESHFAVRTGDAALVVDVMWAWTIQDRNWRTAVDWMFLDVKAQEHCVSDRREPQLRVVRNAHHDDGSRLSIEAAERTGDIEVAETKRVPAGELRVGDTIIIPVCPRVDSCGELYGGSSVVLETIVSITPFGEYGGLEFKTKWRTQYSSGESTIQSQESMFVNKL